MENSENWSNETRLNKQHWDAWMIEQTANFIFIIDFFASMANWPQPALASVMRRKESAARQTVWQCDR